MLRPIRTWVLPMIAALALLLPATARAQDVPTFRVGYVVYVGFMPLAWVKSQGVMDTWGQKHGVKVELVQLNDYIGGINQFIAGDLDAVAVAGMDALTMPAAGGVDTSIFLIADYSNGNDKLLSRTKASVTDLAGDTVHLLQYSVSHYLLNRALTMAGITDPSTVPTVNISDTEIAAAYLTQPDMAHVATWNPMATEMEKAVPGTRVLFDSSQIPGEIMDVFIARTETLKAHPDFARAFTGAWYEAMATYTGGGAQAQAMAEVMASAMGTDVPGFAAQAAQTFFFTTPKAAQDFLTAPATAEIWDSVRRFSFDQGLFGQGAANVDAIGIEVSPEKVLGDSGNIMLRLDPSFTAAAADGTL